MRYAYGICSKVPNMSNMHYPLIDVDSENFSETWEWVLQNCFGTCIFYPTKHGFHIIAFEPMSFASCASFMLRVPNIDKKHVSIGVSRGYWFLETKVPLFLKKVTYMRIER